MDPFTMPAEIVTLLQAAATGAVPSAKHRRESREKRREAYCVFQQEAYRLMAAANHLAALVQIEMISWKTGAVAALPMIGTFLDFLQPEKPSKYRFLRELADRLPMAAALARANVPAATVSFADVLVADTLLMYRVTGDLGTIRDTTADFLTALARVRLIGRPGPVAAAEVVRESLQELFSRIPVKEKRFRLSVMRGRNSTKPDQQRADFDVYLSVLAEANEQLMLAMQADRPARHYFWQFWRPTQLSTKHASELLIQVRKQAASRS